MPCTREWHCAAGMVECVVMVSSCVFCLSEDHKEAAGLCGAGELHCHVAC